MFRDHLGKGFSVLGSDLHWLHPGVSFDRFPRHHVLWSGKVKSTIETDAFQTTLNVDLDLEGACGEGGTASGL